jgi:hypothetical protein
MRESSGQITDEQFNAWFPDPSKFPTHLYDLLSQICYSAINQFLPSTKETPHPTIDILNFTEIFMLKTMMTLNDLGRWGIQAEMGSLHAVFQYDYVFQYGTYIGRLGPDPMGWFDGSAEAAMKTDLMKNHGNSEADAERTTGLSIQGFIRKFVTTQVHFRQDLRDRQDYY